MTTDPDRKPDTDRLRYTADLAGVIESRWQNWWLQENTYQVPNPGEPGFDPARAKFYCLDMFPYPSGAGLHVGHPEGYTATDIVCRFKRMKGFQVLHPMGWDAFGLPAEQHAINTGEHPAKFTRATIDTFRRQLQRFGFSYDWSREFATIDEDYYRWTQWIFLQIYHAWYDDERQQARPIKELVAEFESGIRTVRLNRRAAEYSGAGDLPGGTSVGDWNTLDAETRRMIVDSYRLAYVGMQTVNWCPKLGTALANEEVIDGRSERGGHPVFRKPMRQWMFRITAYADRLISGLADLSWPESTKTQQIEWIGRSEGAEIDFAILNHNQPSGDRLRVFTTRPDTLFGATYMVVAPEHPLVDEALDHPTAETPAAELRAYVDAARNRSDVERQEAKEKTGVFTGYYARNPATGDAIPIWTGDYVLMGYGTGAIMAVPAQDQRDWDFATRFNLPIFRTVRPPAGFEGEAFTGDGPAMNSGFLDGLHVAEAKARMIDWLEDKGLGMRRVTYRLRDWLFSRQRYWGEPFPIVWDEKGNHHAVSEESLPVVLPDMADYAPVESDDPQPLLGKATDWVVTNARSAGVAGLEPDTPVRRETNTMPGWAGSCWYYLRYCDPHNADRFVGKEEEQYWMGGVDRLSEPMRRAPNEQERPGLSASELNQLSSRRLAPVGFMPRDPYPPGEYGPARDLERAHRNIPHFDLPGATYFVSWRTTNGRQITESHRDAVLQSLLHFDGQRYQTYAACVMPDHVHWLVRPLHDHKLADIVSSCKRFSARAVNADTGSEGSLWQPDRFDHVVRDEAWFAEFLEYIVQNPVEAGIAARPSDYRWTFIHADAIGPSTEQDTTIGSESRSTQGGVDLYIGGNEHAVLHLLYARFWHKILFDLGHVSTDEPIRRLFHQGMIVSHAFQRADGGLVPVDQVVNAGSVDAPDYVVEKTGERVAQINAKMSKSLKNVVNPDDVIAEYGADTFRLYEMYMGPLEASKPWNTRDIVGLYRFLQRVWRLLIDEKSGELRLSDTPDTDTEKRLHRTIHKVEGDIERLGFNTAIAALIEFVNAADMLTADQADRFIRALAPLTPHIAEELWHRLGRQDQLGSIALQSWPTVDEAMLVDDEVELPVQILGKLRSKITVPADADENTMRETALADPRIAELIAGKTVRKVVVVPGRLVNIVAN